MAETSLNGTNERINIAPGYAIQAPGIVGSIGIVQVTGTITRTALGQADLRNLEFALPGARMKIREFIEIEIEEDQRAATRSGVRSTNEAVILETFIPKNDAGQALLITDATTGESHWTFPSALIPPDRSVSHPVIYRIPLDPTPADANGQRGPIIQGIRKIVRIIGWVTDNVFGPITETFAEVWEAAKRNYGWQMFPLRERSAMEWPRLRSGKALLCIHGTFSTIEEGFGGLPETTVNRMQGLYNGRMFGFNHPTMTRTPEENVDYLLNQMEMPRDLELDIITHSRGGLVGRELLRRLGQIPSLRVGKLILVASPNRGTPLADGDHWIEMLDRYTTLLAIAPDTALTLASEGILTIIKMIGHAALDQLRGLTAMNPGSPYLQDLNSNPPSNVRYFALAADYRPQGMSLADKAIDGFFGETNDGVVPTAGGYSVSSNGQGWLVSKGQWREFAASDGIHHNTFFRDQRVCDQLCAWLDPAF